MDRRKGGISQDTSSYSRAQFKSEQPRRNKSAFSFRSMETPSNNRKNNEDRNAPLAAYQRATWHGKHIA